TQIKSAVDAELATISLPASVLKNPGNTCPSPTDGNTYHNPPYANSAYPTTANQPWLYICYDNTPGVDFTSPPSGQSQQDVNVIVLYSYGALTPLITAQLGSFHLAANEHITVQGPSGFADPPTRSSDPRPSSSSPSSRPACCCSCSESSTSGARSFTTTRSATQPARVPGRRSRRPTDCRPTAMC